jgi:hypothetical protein
MFGMPGGNKGRDGLASFISLPERQQVILDAGISLYELRRRGQNFQRTVDMGFWDVRAYDNVSSSGSFNYDIRWFDGPSAYIEYRPNKKGICFAFCPDDEFWHNRIALATTIDTGRYAIERLHTNRGVMPGGVATEEISILSKHIHDYKLMINGALLLRSKSSDEINEARNKKLLDGVDEKSIQVVWGKIEPIEALIKVYSSNWFMAPQFQQEIRKEIEAKISSLHSQSAPDPVQIGNDIISQMMRMSPEQRAQVRDLLMDHAQEEFTESKGKSEPKDFSDCTVKELQRLATTYKIDVRGKNKAELVDLVREAAVRASLTQKSTVNTPLAPDFESDGDDSDRYDGVAEEEVA